jgi:S1-C subfamily serine protease
MTANAWLRSALLFLIFVTAKAAWKECIRFSYKSVTRRLAAFSTAFLVVNLPPSQPTSAFDWNLLQSTESQTIRLFQKNTPSVVYINTFAERIDAFSMNVMEVPLGSGSGFVWDNKGHIVTNYHLIQNAKSAKVVAKSADGTLTQAYKATVDGVDPDKDIAVLQVDNRKKMPWRPIQLGSSSRLKVGQAALAIGNPFGLDHTLTTGVISGLGREMRSPSNRPISNVIQTGELHVPDVPGNFSYSPHL